MSHSDPTVEYPDDEEWVNQAPKGLRIPPVMAVLVLILFAVCGFWGGAVLQKHHDKSAKTSTAAGVAGPGAGRRAPAAAGGAGGTGTGTGTAAGRTLGTVSDVEGSTVYLTDAAGNIVKINLGPSTTITKSTSGSVADIQLGQTVIVSGAKGADGSTTAASITISPPAVGGG